jgi:thioredoxin 1
MPIQHVTTLTYVDAILEADKPVLVEFWKRECSKCLSVSNIIHDVVTDFCGLVGVVKVNIDEVPAATKTFHVDMVPRVLVLDRGQIAGDFSGVISKQAIIDVLRPLIR